MKDFRSLEVWELSHEFVLAIYQVTRPFPKEEEFGLTSQIRRSAVSVPSNIAEGCGRTGDAELARFCQIAMGSASEVDYQLELAHDLLYLPTHDYKELNESLNKIRRKLNAFIQKLKST